MIQPQILTDSLGVVGTIVADKYLVEACVAEGGFSVIYKAEHLIWRKPVALKLYTAVLRAPREDAERLLEAFVQEGRLMTELSSLTPGIVQARDVGRAAIHGGTVPFMVLEWLDGTPLDFVLSSEQQAGFAPRTLHQALELLDSAARALSIVHQRGIAHCDLKPANLMVLGNPRDPAATVKVLDFGVAQVSGDRSNMAGRAFTPAYAAPEQFDAAYGPAGTWTDVFALALVVVEMLLGGAPALAADTPTMARVASCDPRVRPTPRALGAQVSDVVEAVFQRALAVNARERFVTVGEFWEALTAAAQQTARRELSADHRTSPIIADGASVDGSGGIAPLFNTGVANPIMGAPESGNASFIASPPPPAPSKSRRAAWGVGVSAALALLGALGFVFAKGHSKGPDTAIGATSAAAVLSGSAPAPSASASSAVIPAIPKKEGCPEATILVAGGPFTMGSDEDGLLLWKPAHKVIVDTVCMDAREVTVARYRACVDTGKCEAPAASADYPKTPTLLEAAHQKNLTGYSQLCNYDKADRGEHPMNCVSWAEADNFCKATGMRLPTEAEWELAARGTQARPFPWGDAQPTAKHANVCDKKCKDWERTQVATRTEKTFEMDDGFEGTAPVGSFPDGRTPAGIDDLAGNVWEWTSDWFAAYSEDDSVNPTGAKAGERKAIRGGGFNSGSALWLNTAFRYHQLATARAPGIGFRCVTRP
jgi:formylglycine-generating enzyme required for sulfatase activity/serine/threonine protein kinase